MKLNHTPARRYVSLQLLAKKGTSSGFKNLRCRPLTFTEGMSASLPKCPPHLWRPHGMGEAANNTSTHAAAATSPASPVSSCIHLHTHHQTSPWQASTTTHHVHKSCMHCICPSTRLHLKPQHRTWNGPSDARAAHSPASSPRVRPPQSPWCQSR